MRVFGEVEKKREVSLAGAGRKNTAAVFAFERGGIDRLGAIAHATGERGGAHDRQRANSQSEHILM